jgi:predicted MPP superfamily phosphohydrolase
MTFIILLVLMATGDLLWCRDALGRPQRWARWIGGTFGVLQFAGLAVILSSREGVTLEDAMPRPLHSMILFWHLIVLLPWLAWRVVRGLVVLAGKVVRAARRKPVPAPVEGTGVTRREFLGTAAAFTPPLLTLGAAAIGEAQLDGFRIRRIDVPVPNLPPALDGLTIAHVSDFHVGRFTRGRVLERVVEETNRLDADVIALTGDFINHSLRDLPAALDIVRALRARHIIAACEGNHDLIEDARTFRREAGRGGLPLLLGETATTAIRGERVQFLGLPWNHSTAGMQGSAAALLARRDPGAWPLLLAHHPHAWDFAEDIPITLSGHTHGGQLMLTGRLGAGPLFYRYWSGLYTRASGALVVSNGVGNWFPVRLQAPAEILHLTLRRTAFTANAESNAAGRRENPSGDLPRTWRRG